MKACEHIDKAAELLADMVADGHLKEGIQLASKITAAQWELKEAREIAGNGNSD